MAYYAILSDCFTKVGGRCETCFLFLFNKLSLTFYLLNYKSHVYLCFLVFRTAYTRTCKLWHGEKGDSLPSRPPDWFTCMYVYYWKLDNPHSLKAKTGSEQQLYWQIRPLRLCKASKLSKVPLFDWIYYFSAPLY